MTASLLLAERHKLLRDALRGLIETQRPDIIIHEAGTVEQLQEHLQSCPELDLLLIDRNMFESHDHFAIENVKAQAPQIRVVVLAERANDLLSQDAIGADGLIHWDLSGRVMMKAGYRAFGQSVRACGSCPRTWCRSCWSRLLAVGRRLAVAKPPRVWRRQAGYPQRRPSRFRFRVGLVQTNLTPKENHDVPRT